jgi:hypothetical protein
MARVCVFIDGGYLNKVLKEEFREASIDYGKLTDFLVSGAEYLRTYYYNCLPYKSPAPSKEESARFAKAERFHGALRRLPHFEVREGRLELRGKDEKGEPVFEQKRIDIMIGVDISSTCGQESD